MALIYCTKCGHRVSTKAPKCPGCGTAVYQSQESPPQQSELSRNRSPQPPVPPPPSRSAPRGRRSRKWIFTVGAVLTIGVIVFLLLPDWAGYKTKEDFTHTINFLTNEGLNITVDSYQRGWFSSKATADVSLGGGMFRLVMHIHQGPFPWGSGRFSVVPVAGVINTRVELPDDLRSFLHKIFGKASAHIQTVVTLGDTLNTHIAVSRFDQFIPYGRGSVLSSKGFEIDYDFSPSREREWTYVRLGMIKLSQGTGDLELRGLTFKERGHKYKSWIWLGHSHLLISSIDYDPAMISKSSQKGSISNISLSNAVTLRHGLIDIVVRGLADRIRLDGSAFGPDTSRTELSGIDPAPIIRFDRNSRRLLSTVLIGSDRQQAIEKMAALGFALARHSPKLSYRETVASPEGQARCELTIGISPGFASDPLEKFTGTNYSSVAQRLLNRYAFASGSLVVPVSIVDRVTSAKDRKQIMSSGLFVQQNNNYVCKIDYSQGQLSANGHHLAP